MSRHARTSHRLGTFESLERRLLWAANLAPSTVNGLIIEMTITAATGDYSSTSGSFQFRASADATTYAFQGALSGSGPYDFGRNSATVVSFQARDNTTLNANWPQVKLTFSSPTEGTFKLDTQNFYWDFTGSMNGTFEITGTTTQLTALDGGLLTVTGTVGADTISLGSAGGNISLTENNYTTQYPASSVTGINLDLREGADVLSVGTGVMGLYCYAGTGNDTLFGGDGADTLSGGAGKDYIDGGLGDDRLNGHGSHDHLIGNAGYDRLYGGEGDDFCEGGGGVDRIWGGNGNDVLGGGGSNDKLFGEAGNDSLYGNAGTDILDGGADTDLATSDGTDVLLNIP